MSSVHSKVLAALIYCPDEEVLTDACWALSYLSDGNNEKIQAVIEAGVCRRLVELLHHHNPGVVTPALRTIGNIVTGNDIQTQVVLNANVLPSLMYLLQHEKEAIKKETCWTISNITAGNRDQIQAVSALFTFSLERGGGGGSFLPSPISLSCHRARVYTTRGLAHRCSPRSLPPLAHLSSHTQPSPINTHIHTLTLAPTPSPTHAGGHAGH
jgi:hypothetical protein